MKYPGILGPGKKKHTFVHLFQYDMPTQLIQYLIAFHEVPENIIQHYAALWKPYELSKKQTLTVPGQTEKYLYFVLEGVQKSYFLHNGKEHVIAFAHGPSISGIPESFFLQRPSRYYLETVTDSYMIRIPFDLHYRFLLEHREIETLFRKIMEIFLDGVIQRQHEIMALSMEDRFKAFTSRSSRLLNIIPHKDIASYLRIDPTNFSKLMNSIKV